MRSKSPIIGGKINTNGTIAIGGPFTVFHNGAGSFILSFLEAISALSCTFDNSALPGTSVDISVLPVTGSGGRSWSVVTRQPGVAFSDMGFSFIATRFNPGG